MLCAVVLFSARNKKTKATRRLMDRFIQQHCGTNIVDWGGREESWPVFIICFMSGSYESIGPMYFYCILIMDILSSIKTKAYVWSKSSDSHNVQFNYCAYKRLY